MSIDIGILATQIRNGMFDADLKVLEEAIRDRQRVRREQVTAQVHEVFGPNHQIVAHRDPNFSAGGLGVGRDRP
jgi:hypothetical protein